MKADWKEVLSRRWTLSPKATAIIAASLLVLLLVLSQVPIGIRFSHSVPAQRYVAGEAVEETSFWVSGLSSRKLFDDTPVFNGLLYIQCYERSCRTDMWAKISWTKGAPYQTLLYTQYGTAYPVEVQGEILVDEAFTEIAVGFVDGSVVASSPALAERYQALQDASTRRS